MVHEAQFRSRLEAGTRRIAVIANGAAVAGEAGKLKQLLFSTLGGNSRLLDCYTVSGGGDLCALTRQAIAGHVDVVAAAGGDGTVSAVASQLLGTDTALGVIPLGT